MAGPEQVLVEDWCQQFPSHSIGDARVRRRRRAVRQRRRRRQLRLRRLRPDRLPEQPVRRSARRRRRTLTPPTAEGGALRAQDLRTRADPTGSTARSCASTRRPARRCRTTRSPASADPDARRIVAYGLRNPFRFTIRPGTNELWIGDVGWNDLGGDRPDRPTRPGRRRELRLALLRGRPGARAATTATDLTCARRLYASGRRPRARSSTYNHGAKVFPDETCPPGQLVDLRPGLHAAGSTYPAEYDGALFFADYSRDCIWVMERAAAGCPDPARVKVVPQPARRAGRPPVRPGRRPLLRRPRRRDDQADPLHRRQPAAAPRW